MKMKRVASVVLTGALVLSMGVAAFAATPSKTVADEVKAVASVETTGFDRVEIKTEETEATGREAAAGGTTPVAQSAAVVKELAAAPAELSTAVGATKEEQVEITAVQTVTVAETPLFNRTTVTVTLSSAVVEAAYKENEEVAVVVMVPVVDKDGNVTYEKMVVTGVVKGGKLQVKLTGAQLKKIGKKSVTMVATKKTAKV